MKKGIGIMLAVLLAGLTMPVNSWAQKKFTVNGKVDFVSDYVWRGAYQNSGFSVQPSLTMSYYGFSLNAWGNQSIAKSAKEFDINLSYTIANFTVMVSDYWWSGVDKRYGDYKNDHFFETTVAYSFAKFFPLSISWSTMFAGGDRNEEGKLQGSTYIQAAYDVALPYDIHLIPSIGFTPWKGMYYDKTAVTDICLKASKEFSIAGKLSLPVFVQAIVSPVYDRTYLVGGVGLAF